MGGLTYVFCWGRRMNLLSLLQQRFHVALTGLVTDPAPFAALVRSCEPKFGDYQFNGAMSLSKTLSKKPREVAEEIVKRLPPDDLFEKVEIAGPGFINLRFRTEWLAAQMGAIARGDRLGIAPAEKTRTVVIDYSSPNVAKPLHVGHLRSTIIGDSLKRLLRFLGHKVVADNHLGDWGLQFGMLLHGYKSFRDDAALQANSVQEMLRLYKLMRQKINAAEDVEDEPDHSKNYPADVLAQSRQDLAACRQETAKLHAGDAENRALWQKFMPWCMDEIEQIYKRLDVSFDVVHGESYYNPMLADVVKDLLAKKIAHPSGSAIAVFFNKQGEVIDPPPPPQTDEEKKDRVPPALVQSSHGAYTYTTTDLATVRDRVESMQPTTVLYVVDFRQKLHFQNVFTIARRWGYDGVEFQHISFGSVLGMDGRPLSTREGTGADLAFLLNSAVSHAAKVYGQLSQEARDDAPVLGADELRQIHEAVGYGAVKYADLSQNRESDYKFDLDKMLANDGNTATYMQYAYARCRSIFRKGDEDATVYRTHPPAVYLEKPEERALALQLLRFEEALQAAADDYRPSGVTAYLWDLAKTYSGFFQNCAVLKAETPALRQSRLLLCDLTARTIQRGLDLLGIRTIERM